MSLSAEEVKKIARLARLHISEAEIPKYTKDISSILDLVATMNNVDTTDLEPLANPLDASQRLRPDVVTETNQREQFQAIAPQVEDGLYIVPTVIEEQE